MSKDWKDALERAVKAGKLSVDSEKNILSLEASSKASPVVGSSIRQLVEAEQWGELNDRFFRNLAFGTGGLRGRTIGKIVTKAEQGESTALVRPEF